MPHHHHIRHNHQHHRRGAWDDFTGAVQSVWDDVNPFQNQAKAGPSTVFRTVFRTMTPDDWDGTAAAWTTLAVKKTTKSVPTTTSTQPTNKISSSTSVKKTSTPDSLPKSLAPTTTGTIPATLALATGERGAPPTSVGARPTVSGAQASETSSAANTGAIGGAAKAGIAIGVLGGVLLVFLAVYFAFSKRRKQMEKQRMEDDEKINGPFSDSRAVPPPTPAKAPRLSLRPVTQFLPNLGGPANQHANRGNAIAMVESPTQQTSRGMGGGPWDRPTTSQSTNSANPFGSGAQRLYSPISEEGQYSNPTSPAGSEVGGPHNGTASSTVAVAGAAAAAAAVAGLTRKTSMRKDNAPRPLDLTMPMPPPHLSAVPPSPAGTEYSMHSVSPGQPPAASTSAAAIAAAGGPAHSTVHRVQLDFNPTMEDEMGLVAGQLVRLLHEYDDGWALCIRLDRSQQGVVPRTCLSTRPVKPRPPQGAPRFGPPVNPNRGPGYPPANRAMTGQGGPHGGPHGGPPYARSASPSGPMMAQGGRPQSPAERAMSPHGGRPSSPAGGRAMSPGPRSMSPGPRSQSPGPRQQQGRPQSPSGAGRRVSPPGPSPMNQEYRPGPPTGPVGRKPVPGQAY